VTPPEPRRGPPGQAATGDVTACPVAPPLTAAVVIRIGTSGWSYGHWHPELYAPGLPARDRLARYAGAFATAEFNSSFYRWPRSAAFRGGARLRIRHRGHR
jgi:hypothetical protein